MAALRIESIADHPNRLEMIARWYWDEWGAYLDPTGSPEGWLAGLRERTHRDRLPTLYVALDGDELLGVAGLTRHDMTTHPELSPWLSGVFVTPAARGRGVASALVRHAVRQAGRMGFARLYLFTPDARGLYERLGWQAIGEEDYTGARVTLMAIACDGQAEADRGQYGMGAEYPAWDAVIVNFNTGADVPACLVALRATRPAPASIIVVDNASSDDSLAILAREPDIRLVVNPENLGFAGGANSGIAASSAPFVAVFNPDVQLRADWPAVLLDACREEVRIGAAGGKFLYPDGVTIQCAGCRLELPRMVAHPIGRGERDAGQYDESRDVDSLISAAIFLRRATLDALGPFDERFFPAYYADVELGYRLRAEGWRVRYVPDAVCLHRETMTNDGTNPRHRFLSHLQRMQFVLKHLDRRQFLTEFLPAEERAFAAGDRYREELEAHIAQLTAELARADPYARSLEGELASAGLYARHLEQQIAALEAENSRLVTERDRRDLSVEVGATAPRPPT